MRRDLARKRGREEYPRAAKGTQNTLRKERGRLGELAQVRRAGVVVRGKGVREVGEGGEEGVVV